MQFVAGSQPVNAIAFVLDGLYYGVADFGFAAYAMVSISSSSVGVFDSPFTPHLQKSLISCRCFGTGDCWIHIFLGHASGCTNVWPRWDLDGFVHLHGVAVSCRSLEVTKQTDHSSCQLITLKQLLFKDCCCHVFFSDWGQEPVHGKCCG